MASAVEGKKSASPRLKGNYSDSRDLPPMGSLSLDGGGAPETYHEWANVMEKARDKEKSSGSVGGAATVQSLEEWGALSERNSDIGTPRDFSPHEFSPSAPTSPSARGWGGGRVDSFALDDMEELGPPPPREEGRRGLGGSGLWEKAKESSGMAHDSSGGRYGDRQRQEMESMNLRNGGGPGLPRAHSGSSLAAGKGSSGRTAERGASPGPASERQRAAPPVDAVRLAAEKIAAGIALSEQGGRRSGGGGGDWSGSEGQRMSASQGANSRSRDQWGQRGDSRSDSRNDSGGGSWDHDMGNGSWAPPPPSWTSPARKGYSAASDSERGTSRGSMGGRHEGGENGLGWDGGRGGGGGLPRPRTMTPDRYRNWNPMADGGADPDWADPSRYGGSGMRDYTPVRYRTREPVSPRLRGMGGDRGGGNMSDGGGIERERIVGPRAMGWSGELVKLAGRGGGGGGGGGDRSGTPTREWGSLPRMPRSSSGGRNSGWGDEQQRANGASPMRLPPEGGRQGGSWEGGGRGGRPPSAGRRLSDGNEEDETGSIGKKMLGWPDEHAIDGDDSPTAADENAPGRMSMYARGVQEEFRRRRAEHDMQAREAERERMAELARIAQYEERFAHSQRAGSTNTVGSRARSQSQERSRNQSPAQRGLSRQGSLGSRREEVDHRYADDIAIAQVLQEEYAHRGQGEPLAAAMRQQMRYDENYRRSRLDSGRPPPRGYDSGERGYANSGYTTDYRPRSSSVQRGGHPQGVDPRHGPSQPLGEDSSRSGSSELGSPPRTGEEAGAPSGIMARIFGKLSSLPHVLRVNGPKIPSEMVATTDHQRLADRLQLYGVAEKKVKGDGNCQFRAVSDQLYQTPDYHSNIRLAVNEQLKTHKEWYASHVPGNYEDYVRKMAKNHEWGDHITLQAAADKYGLRISLLTSFRENGFVEIIPRQQRSNRILWLSFWAEVHYNSLYPEGDPLTTTNANDKKKKGWGLF